MKRIKLILLIFILLGAFVARLYKFDAPIADWHSWRQVDTSAVSRNFLKNGLDLLHPRFDDLSNVPSGIDNPNGYRFVEFPLYNLAQAGLFKIFGIFSLEEWGRLISISSSLLSVIFIYLIVKKYRGDLAAIFAAFFFASLPYNIYYGRAILPDSSMVAALLGGIYFFDKWISNVVILRAKPEESRSFTPFRMTFLFFLSVLFTATSFLLKPYALFFTLPMIYLVWKNFGLKSILKWQLWIFTILTLAPLIFWRIWILQYPEGIPQSGWLFNGGNIRFKGAFFQWIFGDRIARIILGYWGLPLLVLGIITKARKEILKNNFVFFLSFIFSSLLYIFVMARGNVQHDYYQILIIPSIAIFLGFGAEFLITVPKEHFNKTISYLLSAVCIIFMFAFSWYVVRDYFNINNPSIVVAGKAVDKLIPKNSKIIAPYDGDTSFLYQTNRIGWASFEKSLPEMIKMGADYLVLVNPKTDDYNIGKTYEIISAKPEYILFDLHKNP